MPTGTVYVCIKQFNARLGDELSLKVGDKLELLADDSEYNDGWYMGRNLLSGKVGLYPKSFTQVVQEPTAPTLLRSRSRKVGSIKRTKSGTNTPKEADKVGKTMSEIDQALQELQIDSYFDQSYEEYDRSLPLNTSKLSSSTAMEETGAAGPVGHSRSTSVQSLTEDLNPLKATEWTPQQVSSYFAIVLGFDMEIAGKFARHKITGAILFQLDLAHLKELEIDSFGTRFEVHKEIEKLRAISSRNAKHKSMSRSSSIKAKLNKEKEPKKDESDTISELPEKEKENAARKGKRHSMAGNDKLMPSVSLKTHQRKRSQSMDDLDKTKPVASENEPDSKFKPGSPMSKNYKFGSPNNTLHPNHANASAPVLVSRPTSSVYESSMAPSDNRHRRNSSVISGYTSTNSGVPKEAEAPQVTPTPQPSTTPTTQQSNRHSSFFSFLSGNARKDPIDTDDDSEDDIGGAPYGKLISPAKVKPGIVSPKQRTEDEYTQSPKKSKSVSYKTDRPIKEEKRSTSDSNTVSRLKTLRTTSTQNFRILTQSKKSKTSAFQEGIRDINPDEATKTANYSGWMSKRSGNTLSWRSRYFTLHGTRLSYFTSMKDKKEKGLIDITAHKVVPINPDTDSSSNDKYVALYASSTGYGRYCFKLLPPAPGFKKGLTFTQPKTHFFAVDSAEEMRGWLKALMVATIDIDDSVPVVSSCSTPTVSLSKAQELLAKAREETRLKDEELRAKGFLRDGGLEPDSDYAQYITDLNTDLQTSVDSNTSPNIDSVDETTVNSIPPKAQSISSGQPKLQIDTSMVKHKAPSTPLISQSPHQAGFASPYLLASGLLSPKSGQSTSPGTPGQSDYFQEEPEETQKSVFSNSNGRVVSGRKKNTPEKMLAYTSDGSGNPTFVIRKKSGQ